MSAVDVRRRAPRGQGEQLRPMILRAAADLLRETGREEDVSIRAVATRVGVTPPSIYLHFADKEALLDAVCLEAFADFHAVLEQAASTAPDLHAALLAQGRAYVDFALSRPEHYRLMFMRRPGEGLEMPTEAEVTTVAGLSVVIETIRAAQAAGFADADADPVRLAMSVWAAVHGISALLIAKPHFPWGDTDELIGRVLRMCLVGIAPEESPTRS